MTPIQKKVCLVGAVSVGKTSLVNRYVHSLFSEKYLVTIGVKIDAKTLRVGDVGLRLLLWDLAGDDDFQRLNASYLRGSAGYVLVADGSRGHTLDAALDIQSRVASAVGPIPFVLALNKSDLRDQWDVDGRALAELAARGWLIRHTSAKLGTGVQEVFEDLARLLLAPASTPPGPP
ncbi:MAG: GTP-binding protein [Verrucomicrobia bacterium]|nr:GTP-binding protein [Verrucomicrobiota bacterium]